MRVVFLVAPEVHLLDLAGPAQVFGTVGDIVGTPAEFVYLAEESDIIAYQGLPLQAMTVWPEVDRDDIVVVPGWHSGGRVPAVPFGTATLSRIAEHHRSGGTVMSVCSGAFALAAAGLLDGRRATTHHELQDNLAALYPAVRVIHDVLYVAADRVYTSAGIASGIDLALHLVAQRFGSMVAAQVARAMVVYARRNGASPQDSVLLRYRDHVDELVHRTQDTIDEHFRRPLPLAELARIVGASERTVTRSFVRATGITPLRYQQTLRREFAEQLIDAGASVEQAAREVGFEDARMLRRLRSDRGPHMQARSIRAE